MGRKTKKKKQETMAARRKENAWCREMIKEMDIPLLKDENTIAFVNNSRVMVIMRGLPGSGKSTIVRLIQYVYNRPLVCSADDFFYTGNGYVFDASKLKQAHESCQSKASQACENGASPIVIDNTCVRKWEMGHYVKLAQTHNYIVVVIEPQTPWKNDPAELALRNKHGVTEDILKQKVASYERILPYYYAWVLNQKASNRIYHEAERFFHKCLKTLPNLKTELQAAISTNGPSLNYKDTYHITSKPLHCTAFFSKRGVYTGKDGEGVPYWDWPAVQRAVGRSYGIEIIGFVITPRTIGARIRLSERQKRLWNKDDDEIAAHVAAVTGKLANVTVSGSRRGQNNSQFRPTSGHGSRAHLTIGHSKDYSAVQTGLDLVEIINLEEQRATDGSFCDLGDAKARLYDMGRCVVYLNDSLRVSALFNEEQ